MNLTLLVKSLESGQFEASVFEIPSYRVKAESRESAIEDLKRMVLEQVQDSEAVKVNLPIPALARNPWEKLFGLFQDDLYFKEVIEIIQSERDALGDEDIDPTYYMTQN
ncbi:hypothetical protein LEP3755_24150 [Leptolyngbya sp. NIES-3755]|nr:hypothetical protein LEP3755_24150 [Leptolyngbya sp. NIES-3755]